MGKGNEPMQYMVAHTPNGESAFEVVSVERGGSLLLRPMPDDLASRALGQWTSARNEPLKRPERRQVDPGPTLKPVSETVPDRVETKGVIYDRRRTRPRFEVVIKTPKANSGRTRRARGISLV